ncbi:MAG: aminoacyl-tRNA hydrolase, partial [Bacteroidia bacterium]
KTESKVEFSFDIASSQFLSEEQKHYIILKLKNKIDNEGFLHMSESGDRSQYANKEQLVKKAIKLMASVSLIPKKRVPTKVSKSSKRKRVDDKKRVGEVKQTRNKRIDY